jgi:hypothetical protein
MGYFLFLQWPQPGWSKEASPAIVLFFGVISECLALIVKQFEWMLGSGPVSVEQEKKDQQKVTLRTLRQSHGVCAEDCLQDF